VAKPTNETEICNLALDHLNQAPIVSITAPNLQRIESICARWYDVSRRSCLRMHTWNESQKRVSLAALSTTPEFEYSHEYQLPPDYIRLTMIGPCNEIKDYAIDGTKLLCREGGPLDFRYVFDNDVVETFSPLFVDLLALELALNLAYPITANINNVQRIKAMRDEKRGEAFSVDGQERPPRRVERSNFIRARRRIGSYGSPYLED